MNSQEQIELDFGEGNSPEEHKDDYNDIAHLDVQCHLVIKDSNNRVLVNQRG